MGQPPVPVVGTGRWGGEGARAASSLGHGTRQLLEKGRSFAWGTCRGCAPTGAFSSGSGGAGFPRGDVRLLAEGSSHSDAGAVTRLPIYLPAVSMEGSSSSECGFAPLSNLGELASRSGCCWYQQLEACRERAGLCKSP